MRIILLMLAIIPAIYCNSYQQLYGCMNTNGCLNIIGATCQKDEKCWNTLNIRDTCLIQNNCKFPNPEDEYNWPCWHCWVEIFSNSPIYDEFVECVNKFHCSQIRLNMWWAVVMFVMAVLITI